MSDPVPITFNPGRLAQRFSTLQPVRDPVQSASAAVPACCLQTSLRVSSAAAERVCQVSAPPGSPAGATFQILAMPPSESEAARVVIGAKGPAECPPGRSNEVQIVAGGSTSLTRQIPFDRWVLPMQTTFEFSRLARNAGVFLASAHPILFHRLPPALCLVTVPGCAAVGTQVSIAVFPDIRWEGGIRAQVVPDAAEQKGFRIEWENTVRARCGRDEWRPRAWEDALLWCRWLEMLEPLARTVVAVSALREGARDHGFDNPRLVKAGGLQWSWPVMNVTMEARLREQARGPLVEPSLELRCEASPLAAVSGEMSLLGHWLENPLWRQRLAPVLTGILATHPAEIAQEIGVWLVAKGTLRFRISRLERPPEVPLRNLAEAAGGIDLGLQARSNRDYEAIVVRSGSGEKREEPAEISLEVQPPEEAAGACRARLAFSGLAVWSLEKIRPGIRIRRLAAEAVSAEGTSPAPPAPLATLLAPRRWPGEAGSAPVPISWCPA